MILRPRTYYLAILRRGRSCGHRHRAAAAARNCGGSGAMVCRVEVKIHHGVPVLRSREVPGIPEARGG